MKVVSYLIIATISLVVGFSSFNSYELINQKEIVIFQNTFANLEDRYLLEPVFNLILADLKS